MACLTSRRGVHLIEFALTFPIFVVILGSIMEFGWLFYCHNLMVNAVRDGCKLGAATPDTFQAIEIARQATINRLTQLAIPVPAENIDVGCHINSLDNLPRSPSVLVCDLHVVYRPLTGLMPAFSDIERPRTFHTESRALIELPP